MTRSSTTNGELEKPQYGTFAPVSDATLRDHTTSPLPASRAFRPTSREHPLSRALGCRTLAERHTFRTLRLEVQVILDLAFEVALPLRPRPWSKVFDTCPNAHINSPLGQPPGRWLPTSCFH